MIPRYRDHAANERTWLAWIRTGITVMMLGFLVEKFELFLAVVVRQLGPESAAAMPIRTPYVSLVLVGASTLMIVAASARFLHVRRELNSPQEQRFRSLLPVLTVTVLLFGLGLYLLWYLATLPHR